MQMEVNTKKGSFYCTYCRISFPNKVLLQSHCQTLEHQNLILSDEGRDWNYRPPPRNLSASEYSLCSHLYGKNVLGCRLGHQCIQAHCSEELIEWRERYEYRCMILERARKRKLHGATYTDGLLERLNNAENDDAILSEKIDGVECTVDCDLNICIMEKLSQNVWVFSIRSKHELFALSLLYDSHRNHFSISGVSLTDFDCKKIQDYKIDNPQEWLNPNFNKELKRVKKKFQFQYIVKINFKTEIYGTFRQMLVMDFGFQPVMIRKFCVDLIALEYLKEFEKVKTTLITQTERWTNENMDIIKLSSSLSPGNVFNDKLLSSYPARTNKNIQLSQTSLQKYPSKNNYKIRMHDLLDFEEIAQFDLISNFNLTCFLHICSNYLLMPSSFSVVNYAPSGELYAKLELSSELSEDNASGRLILNNCSTVLLMKSYKSQSEIKKRSRLYEASIETKTKNEIYLHLSKETVEELSLHENDEIAFDIQFQLNRLPFCEMHFAIDQLANLNMLFPEVDYDPNMPWVSKQKLSAIEDLKLNIKQKEALLTATADRKYRLPPILLIGPFGTGKTFTLGQTALQVMKQPESRILICCYSNSAADIYILDYFHRAYQEGQLKYKPLRIYYQNRRVATVNGIVQKYCYFKGCQKDNFAIPNKSVMSGHRIIVTTINTSITLAEKGIPKGFFTHIFIDEAAQVMESSTLIPLSFATNSTRVVLAGDYMQMSTEVFSPVCLEKNLQLSLLERLYNRYPNSHPCKIVLGDNYRSHKEIVEFTSKFFYNNCLTAKGDVLAHPKFYPLSFFTVKGEETQDSTSTAYYNNSEVMEVCERIQEIFESWPSELWGPVDQEKVGVVTPYVDQVIRIRAELRKRKLYKVNVERVMNVQGKEYRVIVLSTVRTEHTCSNNETNLDFGFLSNEKLLTTAITRAQSLLAVVGDPVSLCSIGKCRNLWENFIRICAYAGSLHGTNWTTLRNQLDGIELRKIYGLNPLAPEFVPQYRVLQSNFPTPVTSFPTYFLPLNHLAPTAHVVHQNINNHEVPIGYANYNVPSLILPSKMPPINGHPVSRNSVNGIICFPRAPNMLRHAFTNASLPPMPNPLVGGQPAGAPRFLNVHQFPLNPFTQFFWPGNFSVPYSVRPMNADNFAHVLDPNSVNVPIETDYQSPLTPVSHFNAINNPSLFSEPVRPVVCSPELTEISSDNRSSISPNEAVCLSPCSNANVVRRPAHNSESIYAVNSTPVSFNAESDTIRDHLGGDEQDSEPYVNTEFADQISKFMNESASDLQKKLSYAQSREREPLMLMEDSNINRSNRSIVHNSLSKPPHTTQHSKVSLSSTKQDVSDGNYLSNHSQNALLSDSFENNSSIRNFSHYDTMSNAQLSQLNIRSHLPNPTLSWPEKKHCQLNVPTSFQDMINNLPESGASVGEVGGGANCSINLPLYLRKGSSKDGSPVENGGQFFFQ